MAKLRRLLPLSFSYAHTHIHPTDACTRSYDLLCIDGVVQSLRVFMGRDKNPTYSVAEPAARQTLTVLDHGHKFI